MFKRSHHPIVTVIIVTYNSRKYLKKCITAISKQKISLEIIVADNNSTDNTCDFIIKNYRAVIVISNKQNLGYGEAVNQAVKKASGKYILSINADMILGNDYLIRLISIMEKNSQIGAIQGKICTYPHSRQIISTGLCFNYWGILLSNHQSGNSKNTKSSYVFSIEVPLVLKTVFDRIGGYDSHYWLYYEDIDFCWKIWLNGLKVYMDKNTVIYHKQGGSIKNFQKKLMYQQAFYNCLYTYIKNYEPLNVIKTLFLRFIIIIISLLTYLKKGQFDLIKIQIQAWIKIIKNLKFILKERKKIQSKRQISDNKLWQLTGKRITFSYISRVIKNFY